MVSEKINNVPPGEKSENMWRECGLQSEDCEYPVLIPVTSCQEFSVIREEFPEPGHDDGTRNDLNDIQEDRAGKKRVPYRVHRAGHICARAGKKPGDGAWTYQGDDRKESMKIPIPVFPGGIP
jgi:hypothetical protein